MRARALGLGLLVGFMELACRLDPLTTAGLSSPGGDDASAGNTAAPECLAAAVSAKISDGGADGSRACTPAENTFEQVGNPCPLTVREQGPCVLGSPSCDKTCGPGKAGNEICACQTTTNGPEWVCPRCTYDPDSQTGYACYRRADAALCPFNDSDPSGFILSGTPCPRDWLVCQSCGSDMVKVYRDSQNTPHVGYCVCTDLCKWSCASTNEWPPACLTDR